MLSDAPLSDSAAPGPPAAPGGDPAPVEELPPAGRADREGEPPAGAGQVRLLQAELAARDAELRGRDATLESLRGELAAALAQSRRLTAAMDSAETSILISDPTLPDTPVIFCNREFTRVTGYHQDEILGKNCRFLQGPETNPQTVRAIREAIRGGEAFHGVLRNYRKDGSPFWNELTLNPVRDEHGGLTHYVGLQSDVSVRVEALEALRQSQLRFTRMAANVPGTVFQLHRPPLDPAGRFTYLSDGARELFGLDPATARDDADALWATLHPEETGDFRRALFESDQMLTPLSWEGRIRRPDGAERAVQVAARPARQPDGGTVWDGIFLDVTTRRAAEDVLRERGRQSAAVAALGLRALEGTDPETLFREATHVIARHLRVELCTIAETLPGGDNGLVVRAAAGWREDVLGCRYGAGTGSQAGYALLQRRPLVVEDYAREQRFAPPGSMAAQAPVSGISVTVQGRSQIWGAICAQTSRRRRFTPEDVSFVQAVANVLASALDRAEDESALRKSETRQVAILETALDGMLTIDHEGAVLSVNRAVEHTFGHGRDALIGRRIHEVILPGSLDAASPAPPVLPGMLPAYLSAGEHGALNRRIEISARHADGRPVLCELSVTRIPLPGMPQFTVSLRDISARRAADDRMRMLESSVEHANDAVLITEAEPFDAPGPRIIYANRSFLQTTGYTLEEVLGQTPRILQGPNTSAESRAAIRRALQRWRPVRVEMLNYRKDGSEFWVELNIVPVANERGWFTHWVSVQRDITERKRTEEALNHAKEAAEAADRAKSEFLSRMSHELRTPLNAILGFGQLLESQAASGLAGERAGHVVKAGRHLLALIDEVLDIARIESGRLLLSPEPLGLAGLIRESLDLVQPLAEQHGVSLGFEPGGVNGHRVIADRQSLKQVLLNLLSNAVKYNRPGGRVRVACLPGEPDAVAADGMWATATDGALPPAWRVSISDDGAGIPPERRARLFLPFERLGAEHSGVAGTGLGLAISKRLVEAMNGSIGLEDGPEPGSTFWLQLPAGEAALPGKTGPGVQRSPAPAARDSAPAADAPPPEGSGPLPSRVLMIEDDHASHTLVEHLLADRPGVRLITAAQGRLGLDLARRHRPDLILLDVNLPDLRGWEVLAELRSDGSTAGIPVVVVSADATRPQIDRLMAAGARAYLTKPLEATELFQTMNRLLGVELFPLSL